MPSKNKSYNSAISLVSASNSFEMKVTGITITKQQRHESQRFMPSLFKINYLNHSVGAEWRQLETKMFQQTLQQFLKSASMIIQHFLLRTIEIILTRIIEDSLGIIVSIIIIGIIDCVVITTNSIKL